MEENVYLELVLELNSLEILQFSQIPQLTSGVLSSSSQIIAILGER